MKTSLSLLIVLVLSLATANGQIYIQNETPDRGSKWTYRMVPSVDDKKYATDNRTFKDAVIARWDI